MLSGVVDLLPWMPDWLKEPLVLSVWKQDCIDSGDNVAQSARTLQLQTTKDRLSLLSDEGISFMTYDDEVVTIMADRKGNALSTLERFHDRLLS